MPRLSTRNITNFGTRLEVLGRILGTKKPTVLMTPRKPQKLHRLLGAWPVSHQIATVWQVSALTSFLLHVSFAIRPGSSSYASCWLRWACLNRPHFASGLDNPNRRVALGPTFHELELWRWFVDKGLAYRWGHCSSPMYNIIIRPPKLTMFSGASKSAFGGYCLQTGTTVSPRAVSFLRFEQTRCWF